MACKSCIHYQPVSQEDAAKALGDLRYIPGLQSALVAGQLEGACALRMELVPPTWSCAWGEHWLRNRLRKLVGLGHRSAQQATAGLEAVRREREQEAEKRARARLHDAHTAVRDPKCGVCLREHVECTACHQRPASCGACPQCGFGVTVSGVAGQGATWACRRCAANGSGVPALIQYQDGLCEGCGEALGRKERTRLVCGECAEGRGLDAARAGEEVGTCTQCQKPQRPLMRIRVLEAITDAERALQPHPVKTAGPRE